MDSLISNFYLDIKLLIAQAVNFAIVFLILYFFVFKPLFKVMGDRSAKIEHSLKSAQEIEERLTKTKEEQTVLLQSTKAEAAAILEQAQHKADLKKDELITKAKEEIGVLINREKARMQTEKAEILEEIKKEVAEMIALSWPKILAEKMDKEKDKKIIEKSLKNL